MRYPVSDRIIIAETAELLTGYRRLVECANSGNRAVYNQLAAKVDRIAANIARSQPQTLAGIRAKARAAFLLWFGLDGNTNPVSEECVLAATLMQNLAGVDLESPTPPYEHRASFRVIRGGREGHR